MVWTRFNWIGIDTNTAFYTERLNVELHKTRNCFIC